jgi:NADH dehydrogenase
VEATLAALDLSSVERVVFLSYVGADMSSDNEYLQAKAEAEELLHRSGRDYVVFRCTHIFGPPAEPGPTVSALVADAGRAVWVLGSGTQRVAPVYRDDVVEAIVAALEPTAYHGRFDLAGPEVLAMDEFVEVVNGGRARLRHVPPLVARALAHAAPGGLTPELVEIMLADSVADPTRAARAFGLELRSVRDVFRPAAASAAAA